MYPRVLVDLKKINQNGIHISAMCHLYGQKLAISTKLVLGNSEIAQIFEDMGVDYIADSRVKNLQKLQKIKVPKILLRIPSLYEVEKVLKYADVSFHSSLSTLKIFQQEAEKLHLKHGIVLIIDMGDLREGIWYENFEKTNQCIEFLQESNLLEFKGIATNITCFGGILPSKENIHTFHNLVLKIEQMIGKELEIKSFGNSSSINTLELLQGVSNHIRIGEAIFLGRETAQGTSIAGCVQDIFTLEAEILEIECKPSLPKGIIGRDAFGNVPSFVDQGFRKRAIVGIGKQDIGIQNLSSQIPGLEVLGASSDHMVLDIETCEVEFRVGDILKFNLTYAGILSLFTSNYVNKIMIK